MTAKFVTPLDIWKFKEEKERKERKLGNTESRNTCMHLNFTYVCRRGSEVGERCTIRVLLKHFFFLSSRIHAVYLDSLHVVGLYVTYDRGQVKNK